MVHRIEGLGEVQQEGGVSGGHGVDEVVEEDVLVDAPARDVSSLKRVYEVPDIAADAKGEGRGEDLVRGVE